jgi:hypothetical protein
MLEKVWYRTFIPTTSGLTPICTALKASQRVRATLRLLSDLAAVAALFKAICTLLAYISNVASHGLNWYISDTT